MFLDSLKQALDSLDLPEVQDVSMAEPDDDVVIEEAKLRAQSHAVEVPPQEPSAQPLGPSVQSQEPPTGPKASSPPLNSQSASTIEVSDLAPLSHPENDPSHLWPTALGAHTAAHVELKMPIPPPWHENVYYTVSTYIHLLFKGCILGAGLWVFALLVRDVNTRITAAVTREMAVSAQCAEDFAANECSNPRPALVQHCRDLEACMDASPFGSVYRLSALAQSLAETLNSFTEPLSPKSLGMLVVGLGLFIYFTNFAFGFVRARAMNPRPTEVPMATLIYN